jgi:hypothetical protein
MAAVTTIGALATRHSKLRMMRNSNRASAGSCVSLLNPSDKQLTTKVDPNALTQYYSLQE